MALAVFVLALATFAGVSAAPGRIVGGELTTVEEYPSIVAVEWLNLNTGVFAQACGASVLTIRHLLSAAHCFFGESYRPENNRIRAGSTFRNTGGVLINVLREVNHPSYGTPGLGEDGDISVVFLASALVFSPVIQPVTIVSAGFELPDNLPVVHAGWGHVVFGGVHSPQLREVTVFTINRALCTERYAGFFIPQVVTENMICVGILDEGGKDACTGDSGGPLYFDNILVGIVSWGIGCADPFFPSVSVRVSSYTDWVVATAI